MLSSDCTHCARAARAVEGNGNGSRNGSDADDNGDDTARDDNAAGLLSFDEMAQEIWRGFNRSKFQVSTYS